MAPQRIDWIQTGRLVTQKRIVAGLTQYELAHQLGLSVRQLSELERGVVRRPSAQIVEAARRWIGHKLPEVGEVPPIVPEPTPIPRREDIAEGKRRFAIMATADPTFWVGLMAVLSAHFGCLDKLQAAVKIKPRIVRTGKRRRLINELNGP